MKMENMLNSASAAPTTPASHKHTDVEILDILKANVELTPLEAYAKKTYGTVLKGAIEDDEKQSVETRAAENFVRPAALASLAALRAVAAMKG
jgi:hypothetical protein